MTLLRFLSAFVVISALMAVFFACAFGLPGVWVGLGLTALILGVALTTAPQLLNWIQPGEQRTIQLVPERTQTLFVLPQPSANLLIMRSILPGSERIYVSQGAFSLLTHAELTALIQNAEIQSRRWALGFQSAFAALASALCLLAPAAWVQTAFESRSFETGAFREKISLGALCFVAILPWIRFLMWAGGEQSPTRNNAPVDSELVNALRKIERENQLLPFHGNAGATRLYSVNPWKKHGLISF